MLSGNDSGLKSVWEEVCVQVQGEHAASLIEQADALIVAAGAGMGVDSGLPDFRGAEGFWQAYPALREAQSQQHQQIHQ